ncbi:hypothetical protein BH20ACT4_BH20ACT4_05720 [soil metagenome]
MSNRIPAAPPGTKANGKRLWRDVLASFDFEEHELALLREAIRTIDTLDDLAASVARDGPIVDGRDGPKAHPALVEGRQLKIALARLLAALRLPDGAEEGGTQGRRQRRGGVRGIYSVRGGAA